MTHIDVPGGAYVKPFLPVITSEDDAGLMDFLGRFSRDCGGARLLYSQA